MNANIQSLKLFCREAGLSEITAWRFRKRGWLSTVNIAGRQYVTGEEVARFTQRAAAGEFSKKHTTPTRKQSHAEEGTQ